MNWFKKEEVPTLTQKPVMPEVSEETGNDYAETEGDEEGEKHWPVPEDEVQTVLTLWVEWKKDENDVLAMYKFRKYMATILPETEDEEWLELDITNVLKPIAY